MSVTEQKVIQTQTEGDAAKAPVFPWLLYMMIFVFGGIFGFVYEELFYRIDLGYFVKRGITWGPWIPIYGFGAVLIALSTDRLKKNPFFVFILSASATGILEFLAGYLLFHCLGVRLWDYNTEIWNWLNIGGYVCLRSVLFFGISALFLQYIIQPLFLRLLETNRHAVRPVAVTLSALFATDILIGVLRFLLG